VGSYDIVSESSIQEICRYLANTWNIASVMIF